MTTKTKTATGVDRLGLQRLATVACFGALVLGLTACGTLSGAARVDSALYVGPPRTIEAALPREADLASAPFAAPEREARLVAAASADTATDAAPQSAHPVADIPAPDESLTGLMTLLFSGSIMAESSASLRVTGAGPTTVHHFSLALTSAWLRCWLRRTLPTRIATRGRRIAASRCAPPDRTTTS